jgi:MazG family protein
MILPMSDALAGLIALVERLRLECPWDRDQTFDTLKTFLLEECYETLEALDSGSANQLREELGDLLFQVFFLSRLAAERGWFTTDDVARGSTVKMTERHPHVFGETRAKDAQDVKRNWETRKRQTKEAWTDPLSSIPGSLPAVAAAYRMTSRAADLGFDWEQDADVATKIEEELAEWRAAADKGDHASEVSEIGDLLLSVVNLARRRQIDPESALRQTNARFRSRFARVSQRAHASNREISEISPPELDRYWEDAKREELSAVSSQPSAEPDERKS